MGYDLYNIVNKEEFRWASNFWPKILDLARDNGWLPKGTGSSEYWQKEHSQEKWDGNYMWNNGQVVEEDDAKNLAEALKKAQSTLPEEEIDFKEGLSDFIKFCEKGSFTIG